MKTYPLYVNGQWHTSDAALPVVNPASGEFQIGSPLFPRLSLRLQNGKTFRVVATNVSEKNLYIQSATLDGKPLNEPRITWEQIQSGATLAFRMGPAPSEWGSAWRPEVIPSRSSN